MHETTKWLRVISSGVWYILAMLGFMNNQTEISIIAAVVATICFVWVSRD
jgi:hypothetical protein